MTLSGKRARTTSRGFQVSWQRVAYLVIPEHLLVLMGISLGSGAASAGGEEDERGDPDGSRRRRGRYPNSRMALNRCCSRRPPNSCSKNDPLETECSKHHRGPELGPRCSGCLRLRGLKDQGASLPAPPATGG